MESYDAVVVGGGPVGCRTASIIAEAGYSVVILEEHEDIGKPVQCAGIVTPRVLEIAPYRNSVQNELKGACIYSPSGRMLAIQACDTKALAIDRSIFDKEISKEALRMGVEIRSGCKAVDFQRIGNRIKTTYMKSSSEMRGGMENTSAIVSDILIGADGMQGRVGKTLGLSQPKDMLIGIGAEYSSTGLEGNMVHLFSGHDFAPGFFAWAVPLGGGCARVGLCGTQNKKSKISQESTNLWKKRLDRLIETPGLSDFGFKQGTVSTITGGAIPIGYASKCSTKNVMLVGDAAGQAKPTSGGGIYTGLKCASHCGNVAVRALSERDFSTKSMARYDSAWKVDIGKELKKSWTIHRIYSALSDDQLEDVFDILNRPKVLRVIERQGDLDFASGLARPLLKEAPGLVVFAGPFLKSLF